MRIGILAWLAGVMLLHQLALLPSPYVIGFLPITFLGIRCARGHSYRLVSWLLSGFLWSLAYAHWNLPPPVDASLLGKTIRMEGYIASLPEISEGNTRFDFDVSRIPSAPEITLPRHLRLYWRNVPGVRLQPGDHWKLQVRIKSPRGFSNPGSFDYEAWLLQKRIDATGYVRAAEGVEKLGTDKWAYPLLTIRQAFRERLDNALAGQMNGRVIDALVLGIQSGLTEDDWTILRNTGTSHLLAISGLHISLIAGLIYWLTWFMWRYSAQFTLWLAAPRAAAIFGFSAALVYSALAGFSIPTQRACIMLLVVFLSKFFNHKTRPSDLLATALWLILLYDPWAVLASGFWLSFVAVSIIVFLTAGYRRVKRFPWHETLRVQIAICVGILPLLLIFFQQLPLYSPIINLVAVPFVTLLVIPLVLGGSVMLFMAPMAGQFLLHIGSWLIDFLWTGLEKAAGLPFATIHIPTAPWIALLTGIAGLCILALPQGIPRRKLALIALIPMLLPVKDRPEWGEAYFTLLDVGQGLAAVIQTQTHLLIFDTGPRFSVHFDAGRMVILPFMRVNGYDTIDHLIISHGDNDHIGGLQGLRDQVKIQQLSSSVPAQIASYPVSRCIQGQRWEWDGVKFRVLYPPESAYNGRSKENNLSCVLRISTGDQHILLTGDIEAQAEQTLLKTDFIQLAAQILVAPHHGSLTSSTTAFIKAVHPSYVLFATGQGNHHHFPHPQVMSRYQSFGAVGYDTASAGAIRFWLRPGHLLSAPTCYRLEKPRYWQHH